MSFIDDQGRAKQTPEEQLNDQAHDVDGIRPARFGSWGDEGLTFDGLAPDPGEAAREEQMQSRSDFNHEHGPDGRFTSGGDDSGAKSKSEEGKSKSENEPGHDGAKSTSEHISASKAHAVRAIEERAKGNHAEAKVHAEKAKAHAQKAKEGGAHEHGGESAIGHFFKFLNDPLGFFHGEGGAEGGEGAEKKSAEPKVHGFGASGEGGAVNPKSHHHEHIDGSPDQPRDECGRFGSGSGSSIKDERTDYNEDQPRDDHGRFGSGGAGGPLAAKGEGGTAKGGGGSGKLTKSQSDLLGRISSFVGDRNNTHTYFHESSLKVLVDKGLVEDRWTEHGQRVFSLTDAGRAHLSGADPKNAIADKLVGEMASHPYGFSWRPDTEHAKTGIMVSEPASAGFSKVIEFNEAGSREEVRDAVREYVKKNLDKVMSDPQLHIGGWLDKDDKGSRFYLDVSRQHPQSDRQGAIDAGIRHNQKAVWDVDAGAEIKTGGDGT